MTRERFEPRRADGPGLDSLPPWRMLPYDLTPRNDDAAALAGSVPLRRAVVSARARSGATTAPRGSSCGSAIDSPAARVAAVSPTPCSPFSVIAYEVASPATSPPEPGALAASIVARINGTRTASRSIEQAAATRSCPQSRSTAQGAARPASPCPPAWPSRELFSGPLVAGSHGRSGGSPTAAAPRTRSCSPRPSTTPPEHRPIPSFIERSGLAPPPSPSRSGVSGPWLAMPSPSRSPSGHGRACCRSTTPRSGRGIFQPKIRGLTRGNDHLRDKEPKDLYRLGGRFRRSEALFSVNKYGLRLLASSLRLARTLFRAMGPSPARQGPVPPARNTHPARVSRTTRPHPGRCARARTSILPRGRPLVDIHVDIGRPPPQRPTADLRVPGRRSLSGRQVAQGGGGTEADSEGGAAAVSRALADVSTLPNRKGLADDR